MPTLITPKTNEQDAPCNYSSLSQNVFEERHVTIDELKQRCARYKELLDSLQAPEESMIRAANFTTDSVLMMLQQNPSSSFIRVYFGIEENGKPVLFMTPVTEAGTLSTEDETIYVDDCCACPPRLNCPEDEILEP